MSENKEARQETKPDGLQQQRGENMKNSVARESLKEKGQGCKGFVFSHARNWHSRLAILSLWLMHQS